MGRNIDSHAERTPWLNIALSLKARAHEISRDFKISPAEARKRWLAVNGQSSPSGQGASDLTWYYKTTKISFHSAMLLMFHNSLIAGGWPQEEALARSYWAYAKVTACDAQDYLKDGAFRSDEDEYSISYSRARFLTSSVNLAKNKPDIAVHKCKLCASHFVAPKVHLIGKCGVCV